MSGGRLLALLPLAAGALAASGLLAMQLRHELAIPTPPRHVRAHPTPTRRPPTAASRRANPDLTPRPAAAKRPLGLRVTRLLAIEAGAGALILAALAVALSTRRVRQRRRRVYALYELHLSPHDEAKPQDLEDMLEAIANSVRAFPAERARDGQPILALELIHAAGPDGAMEWSLALRCEPRVAGVLDAAISATFPDTRLGHALAGTPQSRQWDIGIPGHVMRLRKKRGFIYPLLAPGEVPASPAIEAIAHTQVTLGVPSVVRFGLTPAPVCFEALARQRYRRHENRLARAERWGLPEGGLRSTLNRAEMDSAQRTQNRSLLWLELVIAADTRATCKQLAATVQARRGENRLHRRRLIARQNLYRRRFPTATPPLVPSPRALISAAEAAQLLELPSARMKGVPVRRTAIPRIPMPPEILRADPAQPVPTPPPDSSRQRPRDEAAQAT